MFLLSVFHCAPGGYVLSILSYCVSVEDNTLLLFSNQVERAVEAGVWFYGARGCPVGGRHVLCCPEQRALGEGTDL